MTVADSDVLIDALRGREPARGRVAQELGTGALATTAITVFELLAGVRTAAERETVGRLLAALRILPFDEAAAGLAAEARRSLEEQGTPLPMADCLIAGICISQGASLLTRNRKHFQRVGGLALAPLAPTD